MYIIVIWYNPNNNSYYYRKYYYSYSFEIGYKNSYGHEVILIIDIMANEKISLKKRLIDRLIAYLRSIR